MNLLLQLPCIVQGRAKWRRNHDTVITTPRGICHTRYFFKSRAVAWLSIQAFDFWSSHPAVLLWNREILTPKLMHLPATLWVVYLVTRMGLFWSSHINHLGQTSCSHSTPSLCLSDPPLLLPPSGILCCNFTPHGSSCHYVTLAAKSLNLEFLASFSNHTSFVQFPLPFRSPSKTSKAEAPCMG